MTLSENVAVTVKPPATGLAAAEASVTVGATVSSVIVCVDVVEMLVAASLYWTQAVFTPSPADSVSDAELEKDSEEVTATHEALVQLLPSATRYATTPVSSVARTVTVAPCR